MFKYQKKFHIYLYLSVIIFSLFLNNAYAAKNAIGIRIVRNSEHLSPSSWYNKYAPSWYGGSGSSGPSLMSLAGYEAVRVGTCSGGNGETVYANAANTESNKLYTNIYIISCPVGAGKDTIDIFNQLISNWSFNVNITGKNLKQKIQRDTERLSELGELRNYIENYRDKINKENKYPKLEGRTREKGKTVDYLNSWQNTLGAELQKTLPVSPAGQGWSELTDCDTSGCSKTGSSSNSNLPSGLSLPDELKDANIITSDTDSYECEHTLAIKKNKWAEFTSGARCVFQGWTPVSGLDMVPGTLNTKWPNDIQTPLSVSMYWDDEGIRNFYVVKNNKYRTYKDYNRPYIYNTIDGGLSYSICTNFETSYTNLLELSCSKAGTSNYTPSMSDLSNFDLSVNKFLNYDIFASDIDNDNIFWEVDFPGCDFQSIGSTPVSCDWGNNGTIYATKLSQKENTIKIYGTAPLNKTTGTVSVKAKDGKGGIVNKSFLLSVSSSGPVVTSIPKTKSVFVDSDYQYDVEAYDAEDYYPLSYSAENLPTGLSINEKNGLISGKPTSSGTYNDITVKITNSINESTSQKFSLQVLNFVISDISNTSVNHDETKTIYAKTEPEIENLIWSIKCTSGKCENIKASITELGKIELSLELGAMKDESFTFELTAEFEEKSITNKFDAKVGDYGVVCTPDVFSGITDLKAWDGTGFFSPNHNQVMATPMIADINADETPDIVFVSFKDSYHDRDGVLRVLSGNDMTEIFSLKKDNKINPSVNIAVGDIDNNGSIDIAYGRTDNYLSVASSTGATLKDIGLKSTIESTESGPSGSIVLADLDSSGDVEIVTGRFIVDYNESKYDEISRGVIPIASDVDLDGYLEVITNTHIEDWAYSSDNSSAKGKGINADCNLFPDNPYKPDNPKRFIGGYSAIGNFDDDNYPEIVLVYKNIYLFDVVVNASNTITCEKKWDTSIPGGGDGGAPTIADFDNDGKPEIGVAGARKYIVLEDDGTIKWEVATKDGSSHKTGSSVFDFNGDNRAEVVYNDQEKLRIYDGETGYVLYEVDNITGTLFENPVIVDVDGNNKSEIVVPANNYGGRIGRTGIRIFEHDSWLNTRKIWNQHSYHITNINENGTIPKQECVNWLSGIDQPKACDSDSKINLPYNNFRKNQFKKIYCANYCGNKIVDPGEACDDGNTNNEDGCDIVCRKPSS